MIAHGSRWEERNAPIVEFGRAIGKAAMESGRFTAVRTAFLEIAQPDIPTSVAELEQEGCTCIVAVPLFIAPGEHVRGDLPHELGIASARAMKAGDAGTRGPSGMSHRVPVVMTETLSEGTLLEAFAEGEVRRLSKSPSNEAVVLLAHGAAGSGGIWERRLHELARWCGLQTQVDYAEVAFVQRGQSYHADGVRAIRRALGVKQRVIVVGLYVCLNAKEIHQRAVEAGQVGTVWPPHTDVVFSDRALIQDARIARWILQTASRRIAGRKNWGCNEQPNTA